ncbi:MAG: efflux RND transporter periplasmic adaptor subunit [Gemmatimonadetes bacterium]|nr:efflux RND transporter periplasmic adaptor subunit [Gemmatimonadota bacterium]
MKDESKTSFVRAGALFTLAALATGCGGAEAPDPVYRSVAVANRDIVLTASASGEIEPVTTVEVKSKASGEVIDLAVETGSRVAPGDLLVRIDRRSPRNSLHQAEADFEVGKASLANSEAELERSERLYANGSITEQDYEASKLAVAVEKASLVRARAALEDARIAYEDTELRSPVRGVVIAKNVEVGSVISSATRDVGGGTVLLTLANLDTVQVRALIDETDIGRIEAGMTVEISVNAYPNRSFEGVVAKIEPVGETERSVTMFPALVRIVNTGGFLRPGMSAEVAFHLGERLDVVTVPNSALRQPRDMPATLVFLGIEPADGGGGGDMKMSGPGGGRSREGGGRPESGSLPAGSPGGGGRPGGGPGAESAAGRPGGKSGNGPSFFVFVKKGAEIKPFEIKTGMTDLDYTEVIEGVAPGDSVLILPTPGLIRSQTEFNNRIQRLRGGGLPGRRSG